MSKKLTIDYLILFMFAIIPFWRIGLYGFWENADVGFPIYPIQQFSQTRFLWSDKSSLGSETTFEPLRLPLYFLFAVLSYVGLPSYIIERTYLISTYTLLGWSMYHLVSSIFKHRNGELKRVACLTSSIYYMFNPYVVRWIYIGAYPYVSALAMLPFAFTFMVKGFQAKSARYEVRYVVLAAFFFTMAFSQQPRLSFVILLFPLGYIVFRLLQDLWKRSRLDLFHHLKLSTLIATLTLTLSFWWILPVLYSNYTGIHFSPTSPGFSKLQTISSFSLIHIQRLRLQIYPPNAILLTNWNHWIASPLIMTIGLLLVIVAFSYLLFEGHKDMHVVFIALITVFTIGLSFGINLPFGLIYSWLFNNLYFFRVFNDPGKFLHVSTLGVGALLGLSTAEIYQIVQRWRKPSFLSIVPRVMSKVTVVVLICLVFLNSYPLLSGNLDGMLETMHIPDYYVEAREWLQQQIIEDPDIRVMLVPQISPSIGVGYSWGPKYVLSSHVSIPVQMFPVSVLDGMLGDIPLALYGDGARLFQHVYDLIINNKTRNIGRFLTLLNVKYVCVADDLIYSAGVNETTGVWKWERVNTTVIRETLEKSSDLKLVKTFGALSFYLNVAYSSRQLFYGATTYALLPTSKQFDSYQALSYQNTSTNLVAFTYDVPDVIRKKITSSFIEISRNISGTVTNSNKIIYTKVNPTKYEIDILADRSFVLVFSENYSNDWEARIASTGKTLEHFPVNFFANGWYLNKTGRYTVIVQYTHQKYLDCGILASSLSFIIAVATLFSTFGIYSKILKYIKRHTRQ